MKIEQIVIEGLARLGDLAPAGFAIALHVRFQAPSYMFESYPPSWLETYAREGFLLQDPTVRSAMRHPGTTRWSELAAFDEADVLGRARAHGLVYGISHSIHDHPSLSMGGMARSDREFTKHEIREACAILQRLHDVTHRRETLGTDVSATLHEMAIVMTERPE
ncbi:autoinducer binding domain-containing protein [Limimaricola sp. G21655-S1]|uniref:autoinducer binding domain-containing protein n=1 Tax=Limimaricola sp. G21655-S1 TaxID=3014768 RepID=UPI0022B07888|nr:autoinducer binding domain-containing protein [Limimaricola sp. G21655-S1]MCZ4260582.1 autoinducer binding domain-containing protein [Limimaricola sp. G21655-S1]